MLPVIRAQSIYPGQLGVPGSDVSRGLRSRSCGVVFYVDENHPNATATADGTDPNNPLTTITAAFTRLAAFHALPDINAENSVIVIAPGEYPENIVVAQTTYPDFCTILGGGNGRYPVIWNAAAGDCLTIDAYGWLVDGIQFLPPDDGAGIKLTRTAATAGSEGTVIQNCFFNGGWGTGLYGVELEGAPANVSIIGNRFAEFGTARPCITVTDTSTAEPYQTHIVGNTFQECGEYIARDCAGGWAASLVQGNVFAQSTGALCANTVYVDMRGGAALDENVVTGNFFGGVYSQAGGYFANATATDQGWVGNVAESTPGTVADNGITIRVPA